MGKLILPLICITIAPLLLQLFMKWMFKKKLQQLQDEDSDSDYYHQCKFITMKQFNCRAHLLKEQECSEYCSSIYEKTILSFISSAKMSICLCMYMVSLKKICFAMIKASKRGVKIRVITDKIMLKTDVMQINFERLAECGK